MNLDKSTLIRAIVPLGILLVLVGLSYLIRANPPETPRSNRAAPRLVVSVKELVPTDYQVQLESYGTVQPRTQSMLVSQVGGQITQVNPAFRDGGFFEKGEVLVQIDNRDYEADVKIAEAGVLDARQALAEAEARSAQALTDWQRLGNTGEPPPLVRREPQLLAAQARVASAEATLRKAALDLSRTRIIAPFAGRVLRQNVDLGQVVNANTTLGEIYATDVVEVRLPLRNRDLAFISLPEQYRFDTHGAEGAIVEFRSDLGDGATWLGRLVRTEGAIDETARQLYVAAEIKDPYGSKVTDSTPLKIGQYVTASIAGEMLENALVIPNESVYQGTYVYVVENGLLDRRTVNVTWQNDVESVVESGIEAGELIVTTQLGQVTSGTRVSIEGAADGDRRETTANNPTTGAAASGGVAQ